jgi:tetraacyldisaccharide 4'-kinase
VLSRGYGRRVVEDGAVIVSDGARVVADLDRAGDEPLWLAQAVPGASVVVCEQRTIAAALARRVLGATVLILDDGFQHRAMRRDVDVVAIAPEDLRDRVMPFGRLRQPVSALRAADAIVTEGAPDDPVLTRFPARVFTVRRALGTPEPIDEGPAPPAPGAGPVIAVAGIARPERFWQALEAQGWCVASRLAFRDHHPFRRRDIEAIARTAREAGAVGVLTTGKDAVRLAPWRPLPVPVFTVPLAVEPEPADAFAAWLFGRLAEARAR